MKNIILKSSLFIAILGITFWSCKKEPINSTTITNSEIEPLKASNLRYFYDNGQTDDDPLSDNFGCRGVGGNCLPDFVVTGLMSPNFLSNLEIYLESSNPNDIIDFFIENQAELNQFIPINIIEDVINGNLTVSHAGTLEDLGTLYIKIYDNNNLIHVYPIK